MASKPSAATPRTSEPSLARRNRIPLGRTGRRLSFERRLHLWLTCFGLACLVPGGFLLYRLDASPIALFSVVAFFGLVWLIAGSAFIDQIIRPLQTLANVISALREDDFSFRARGARRGDSLGDLALEINALAATLQAQRSAALEALNLLERVMSSMQSPVLAFDEESRLRLHNAAADRAFALSRHHSDGRTASELHLDSLLNLTGLTGEAIYPPPSEVASSHLIGAARYAVRRTTFRLRGVPHVLLVLSDVRTALREEERQAWQRLIRVLGHEINNSLTPIKSIAGSLRARIAVPAAEVQGGEAAAGDLHNLVRGLAVIEDRADSLNRFLQAYQQLSTLPAPRLQPVPLGPLLERVAHLETRVEVQVRASSAAAITLEADPDQFQQVLINLIQNATDAALEAYAASSGSRNPNSSGPANLVSTQPLPRVEIRWAAEHGEAAIRILDNGLGLLNPVNLFVPFYTTKPNGTGIGLALAQQILMAHKGSVSLANRTDARGCIAEVRLPLEQSI